MKEQAEPFVVVAIPTLFAGAEISELHAVAVAVEVEFVLTEDLDEGESVAPLFVPDHLLDAAFDAVQACGLESAVGQRQTKNGDGEGHRDWGSNRRHGTLPLGAELGRADEYLETPAPSQSHGARNGDPALRQGEETALNTVAPADAAAMEQKVSVGLVLSLPSRQWGATAERGTSHANQRSGRWIVFTHDDRLLKGAYTGLGKEVVLRVDGEEMPDGCL